MLIWILCLFSGAHSQGPGLHLCWLFRDNVFNKWNDVRIESTANSEKIQVLSGARTFSDFSVDSILTSFHLMCLSFSHNVFNIQINKIKFIFRGIERKWAFYTAPCDHKSSLFVGYWKKWHQEQESSAPNFLSKKKKIARLTETRRSRSPRPRCTIDTVFNKHNPKI